MVVHHKCLRQMQVLPPSEPPTDSAPVPGDSLYIPASKAQKSPGMNQDTPPNIDELVQNLADAIDDLEITGDPPRLSELMEHYILAAIEEVEGPDVDADMRLRELLQLLVQTAAMFRNSHR
jgi:hypothetical protein